MRSKRVLEIVEAKRKGIVDRLGYLEALATNLDVHQQSITQRLALLEKPSPAPAGERSYTVHLTGDEVQALLGGLVFVNTYFGAKPDPPTPEMRVQAKLEQALEREE